MATANHVLLRRITLTQSASTVTFNSIPQTGYTDLKFVISARTASGGVIDMYGRINGDTGSNYTFKQIQSSGSASGSAGGTNSIMLWGTTNGSSDTANTFANTEIYIPNYTSSNQKSASSESVTENNATTAYSTMRALLWSGTSAINTVSFYNNSSLDFAAGSSFALYGIADVNTTPTAAPKADGGDIITTDGTYWIHTFLSSGIFKPQLNLTCDYLVVAGGGSGSGAPGYGGGGGGAGGYRTSIGGSPLSLSAQGYLVTVGAGGATRTTQGQGNPGSDSTLATITSIGGGGGGIGNINGGNGGSGGGGGSDGTGSLPGSGTSGQGNNGGLGYDGVTALTVGGGGGGAGAVGGAATPRATNANGGAGGNGLANSISGTSVTYAGGGGGGNDRGGGGVYPGTGGVGGTGGGGNGGTYTVTLATPGAANTGGGGGGSSSNTSPYTNGAAGGSGIVIIRYPVA